MDTPESVSAQQTELNELRSAYEDLRHVVVSGLFLLLIISASLDLYFLRQWRFSKADLATLRPQVQQLAAQFNHDSEGMKEFVRRLVEYDRSHPDFAPIAAKYRLEGLLGKPAAPPPISISPMTAPGASTNKK
jgi:hypothetical protein